MEQVREADAVQHLVAHAVDHREGHRGAVLGRIDMDAERALAEGHVDQVGDGDGHGGWIGVRRGDAAEGGADLLGEARRRAGGVLGEAIEIGRAAGMGEVVGAAGEGASASMPALAAKYGGR